MLCPQTIQTIILACNITVPGLSFDKLQAKQSACRDRLITCVYGNSSIPEGHTLEECLFSLPKGIPQALNQQELDKKCNK